MAKENKRGPSLDTERVRELESDLYNQGFDIFHPFSPSWYNDSIERDSLQKELVCLPKGKGFLIGNTKHLWPLFKEWYRRQLPSLENPLDTYCRECIRHSLGKHFEISRFSVYSSAETSPDKLVSMQRVAMESGFAHHDPTTQLTVHHLYGPWNAYRAVVILHEDSDAVDTQPPPRSPCLLTPQEHECARKAMEYALEVSDVGNLCRQLHGGSNKDPDMLTVCEAWIAMRDCIETGKAQYRYDSDQLLYHYTKDKKYL
mmetsp:Transcript_70/g.136  ORF Transcript_70/g.136 Transcript_70/m.136 type:complete len:258 (+) Transcript_70:194-967(+)|eukprot:CAMPEP_0202497126 /NCGR_PEP_ID=MMETSP1361-20130828/22019_1 /ASSEMBLY_ACC=CAM_ASM_000849 /TAXON_ID=210615 /ORGANISM="Staurosira complex sp., Strain CCMP2646" /LENGTH=257 /DNA_ID=CAMNT_0049128647 /DNA_START=152 /DNA_END=925 /DNA_ORIENTATION=-